MKHFRFEKGCKVYDVLVSWEQQKKQCKSNDRIENTIWPLEITFTVILRWRKGNLVDV